MKADTLGDAMPTTVPDSKPAPPLDPDFIERGDDADIDDPVENILFFLEKAGIPASQHEVETLLNTEKAIKLSIFSKIEKRLGNDANIVAQFLEI